MDSFFHGIQIANMCLQELLHKHVSRNLYTHTHIYMQLIQAISVYIYIKCNSKISFFKNYSWTFFFSKEDIQVANTYTKGHPASLAIREIQIRTTPVRMAIIKKTTSNCQQVCGVREPLYTMEDPQKPKNRATT